MSSEIIFLKKEDLVYEEIEETEFVYIVKEGVFTIRKYFYKQDEVESEN